MNFYDIYIDALIPGDPDLGLPSASEIQFDRYLKQYGLTERMIEFIDDLENICIQKFEVRFFELDSSQKLVAINGCKVKNSNLYSTITNHLFKAYYTNTSVLLKIGAGSIPPFPNGNILPENDWDLLEPVMHINFSTRLEPDGI